MVVYLTSGLGLRDINIAKMAQLVTWLRMLSIPWMVMGDFNATPSELAESRVLDPLSCYILPPENTAMTCTAGQGRLIDYVVASSSCRHLLGSVRAVEEVPWKTHAGIQVTLARNPVAVQIRRLITPRHVELPKLAAKLQAQLRPLLEEQYTWQAAARTARRSVQGWSLQPTRYLQRSVPVQVMGRQVVELAKEYCLWITTAEVFLAVNAAGCNPRDPCIMDYIGRGAGPWMQVQGMASVDNAHRCWRDPVLNALDAVASLLRFIIKLHGVQNGYEQQCKVIDKLVERLGSLSDLGEDAHQQAQRMKDLGTGQTAPLCLLKDLQMAVDKHRVRVQSKVYAASSKQFQDWLMDSGTFGNAYKWLRHDPAAPQLAQQVVGESGQVLHEPLRVMENRVQGWMRLWARDAGQHKEVVQALCDLRQAALEQAKENEFEVDEATEALLKDIGAFKPMTGKGADGIRPSFLRWLPQRALEELAMQFHRWKQKCALPWQLLHMVIAMLAKPSSGERPIALEPLVLRVFLRQWRSYGQRWSAEKHGFWDDAVAGSSALRAGLLRSMLNESAIALGFLVVEGLWDLEKYYDSISATKLVAEARALDFDCQVLFFVMMANLSPRALRADTCCSEFVLPQNSVLQGNGQSCNLAKVMLHRFLEEWHNRYRPCTIRQFVDDLPQRMEGTRSMILRVFPQAAAALVRGLARLSLSISKKSALVVSDITIKAELEDRLKGTGVPLRWADHARDLGIDNSAARRRVMKTPDQRLGKARNKLKKIRGLPGKLPRKRFLTTTVMSQAMWGHQVYGYPPTRLSKLRSAIATALPQARRGSCTTTLLALAGPGAEPAVTIRQQLVMTWLDMWHRYPHYQHRWRRAWPAILERMRAAKPRGRWQVVRGGLSTLIATLLDMQWQPDRPDRWTDDRGNEWVLGQAAMDSVTVLREIEISVRRQLWRRAAGFHLGAGLQHGVVLAPRCRQIAAWSKNGLHRRAGALHVAATAGMWPPARVHAVYRHTNPGCVLCGHNYADEHHCIWECKALHEQEAVGPPPRNLHRQAAMQKDTQPCLFQRGIIPQSWVEDLPAPAQQMELQGHGGLQDVQVVDLEQVAGTWHSDGSGGEHTRDPLLRRAAWSLVWLGSEQEQFEYKGAWLAALDGENQTVNRAELMPAIVFAEHTRGPARLHSDSAYLVNGFHKGYHLEPPKKNGDLWWRLGQALRNRQGSFTIAKVKAHQEVEQVQPTTKALQEYIGNAYADALAGRAATMAQLDPELVATYQLRMGTAMQIIRRIGTALESYLEMVPKRNLQQQREQQKAGRHRDGSGRITMKQRLKAASKHPVLKFHLKEVSCPRCGQHSAVSRSRAWVVRECTALSTRAAERQEVAKNARMQVGGTDLHQSHQLCVTGKWCYCRACGCYVTIGEGHKSIPRMLAQMCKKFLPVHRSRILQRLSEGRAPYSWMERYAHRGQLDDDRKKGQVDTRSATAY